MKKTASWNSNELSFGKYIIKSISEFNASVSSGSLSTVEGMASTRNEWNFLKGSVKYTPAHLLVAYDNNGQQVNVGDYKYDNQLLLKFNILLNKEPKRDYQHVYVGNQLIKNIVTTIYSLKLEDTMYYFKKFSDVKKFMLKFIQQHSVEI